ncbi:MAG: OsmC family protein [Alphaproteobacteria bacterium]
MSEYRVTVLWRRTSKEFTYETYNRNHVWRVGEGTEIEASAAPQYRGDGERLDPEEAFVGALSSCHMLTFLAIAARKHLCVDSYQDEAAGLMTKGADGRLWVSTVMLHPRVGFSAGVTVSRDELARLHRHSHEECFIANSVKTEVTVEPRD